MNTDPSGPVAVAYWAFQEEKKEVRRQMKEYKEVHGT